MNQLFSSIIYNNNRNQINRRRQNNIINNYENVCLISKEKIKNKITLNCNHNFEYLYLYKEILQSTKNKYKNIFD